MTSTAEYLDTLASELIELGPVARAMLSNDAPLDPIVLLSLVQTAALALHDGPRSELSPAAIEEARAVLAAARRKPGKGLLERTFDALDLDAMARLDASPHEEPEELESRLHDVFELGFLADVLTGARRARLVGALDAVAGEVLAVPDAHGALYETAFLLRGIAELPDDHPVAELLDTIVATTDTLANLDQALDAATTATLFAEARARYESALSPIERLVRWAGERWANATAALAPAPLRALATTGLGRPVWPAPRIVLDRRDGLEVALWPLGDHILVELAGRSLPSSLAALMRGAALAESARWHPSHQVWTLPSDVELASLAITVLVDGMPRPVRTDAAALVTPPATDLRERLPRAILTTPGWTRRALLELAGSVEREGLALALDFQAQAAGIIVPRLRAEIGRASFVAIPDAPHAPGFLVHVGASGLAHGAPLARLGASHDTVERVARWIGALVGAPAALGADALDLRVEAPTDLTLEGESWQLAAALAVISERLAIAPVGGVAVSGRLGDGVGEVLPVERVADKRAALALELPTDAALALALIVDRTIDIRPELARLFGDDWAPRLRASLGVIGDGLARDAMRAWRGWFGRRNVADATADRDRALDLAERALAAGVSGLQRVEALWVEGACRLHRGESLRALDAFAEVDVSLATLSPGSVAAFTREELVAYHGIAVVDLGRPREAVDLVRPALDRLDEVRGQHPERVDRRYLDVRLQVAGTLARATTFAGDLDEARRLLRESLTLEVPAERARTLMDLAELARRAGDPEAARALLAEARAALDDIPIHAVAAITERFLRLYEARAGVAPADAQIEPPRWSEWPQPAEVLESLVSGPRRELESWVRTHILSAPEHVSTIHLIVVLTSIARASLADEANDPVLSSLVTALVDLAIARPEIEPAITDSLAPLREGDVAAVAAWIRRFPY